MISEDFYIWPWISWLHLHTKLFSTRLILCSCKLFCHIFFSVFFFKSFSSHWTFVQIHSSQPSSVFHKQFSKIASAWTTRWTMNLFPTLCNKDRCLFFVLCILCRCMTWLAIHVLWHGVIIVRLYVKQHVCFYIKTSCFPVSQVLLTKNFSSHHVLSNTSMYPTCVTLAHTST